MNTLIDTVAQLQGYDPSAVPTTPVNKFSARLVQTSRGAALQLNMLSAVRQALSAAIQKNAATPSRCAGAVK